MAIPYQYDEIRKLRRLAGMSQQELADALDINRVTLARFETGVTESMEILIKYASHFHVDYRKFMLPANLATNNA